MFTGLIEEIGTISKIFQNEIQIKANFAQELSLGDSVCINGTCLTVTKIINNEFCANISDETLSVTNWKLKKIGDKVNLERALKLNSRIDGHLVYGHIDTTSKIINIEYKNGFCNITLELKKEFNNLIVNKGSITVDGISLTIANISSESFDIAIIPHTIGFSTIQFFKTNQIVNIEFDMIAKYVEKKLAIYDNKSKVTMEFLEENGFV